MKKYLSVQPILFFLILYTIISGAVFFYILYNHVPTDMGAHIHILLRFLDNGSFPIPPLYYALVYGLHFIMPYKEGYGIAAWLVLTAAGFLKYLWSINYLKQYCPSVDIKFINLFAFALMFFAPITLLMYEGEYWYLGKFTSVIWHNSTTLLSLPFCVLLFHYTMIFLEDRKKRMLGKIFIISILIILIKPSFIFSFLPVFTVTVLLVEKKLSKIFFLSFMISLVLFSIILLEKFLIYDGGMLDELFSKNAVSNIGINPFHVWLSWTDDPIRDFLTSFTFPIVFVLFYLEELKKDIHFLFSSFMVLIGLVIFFLIVETGPRILDGNFYWQIILTLFIWYLVLIKNFLTLNSGLFPIKKIASLNIKNKILLILFLAHVFSGFAYLFRIILSKVYF